MDPKKHGEVWKGVSPALMGNFHEINAWNSQFRANGWYGHILLSWIGIIRWGRWGALVLAILTGVCLLEPWNGGLKRQLYTHTKWSWEVKKMLKSEIWGHMIWPKTQNRGSYMSAPPPGGEWGLVVPLSISLEIYQRTQHNGAIR